MASLTSSKASRLRPISYSGRLGSPGGAPVLRSIVLRASHFLSDMTYLNSPPFDVSMNTGGPRTPSVTALGRGKTTETAAWPSVPVSVPDLCDSRSVPWSASMP